MRSIFECRNFPPFRDCSIRSVFTKFVFCPCNSIYTQKKQFFVKLQKNKILCILSLRSKGIRLTKRRCVIFFLIIYLDTSL